MVEIAFFDNGKIIKGILLAKYCRPHDEVHTRTKKFLWKSKIVYEHRTLNTPLYVIFIPWKHREKEIVEIDEKYIVNPEAIHLDKNWIKKERFISKSFDGCMSPLTMEVNDFTGYPFIFHNNNFLIDLVLQNKREVLSILYKHMPELLEIDLVNAEE